jgi:hypothetical protein
MQAKTCTNRQRNEVYMNSHELKQERRRQGLLGAAEAATKRSDQAYQASKGILDRIEPGQPILVGHHSEGRHRRDLERSDNNMRRSIAESDRAAELKRRADAVGTAGISSDDPDALSKLQVKLEGLKAKQERMKAANKAIRSGKTPEAQVEGLVKLGYSESEAAELLKPDFCQRVGYPSFALTNNNATIRQVEGRIKSLEAVKSLKTAEIQGAGYTYREDAEEGRVMFIFPEKPDKACRETLKDNGFKWSPTRDAWVRMLNGNGQWAGKQVRTWLEAQK